MAYLDQHQLAQDEEFQARVAVAALSKAIAVMGETDPDPAHVDLAGRIIRNPTGMAQTLALAVVTNKAITATGSDSVISNALSAMFGAIATATDTTARTRTVQMVDGA